MGRYFRLRKLTGPGCGSQKRSTHSHLKNLTTFLVNFVPVDKVDASELQVRVHFDDSEVEALAHSIKEHGVLQPILVGHCAVM